MKIRPLYLAPEDKEDDFWVIPGYVLFPWDGIIRFPMIFKDAVTLSVRDSFVVTKMKRSESPACYEYFNRVTCTESCIPRTVHRMLVEIWNRTNRRKLSQAKTTPELSKL